MAERLPSTSWGASAPTSEYSSWDTDWGTPTPKSNSWESSSSSWDTASQDTKNDWDSWESELSQPSSSLAGEQQTTLSEKIGELRQKLTRSFGRKALEAAMGRLPAFGGATENVQNTAISMYENPGQFSDALEGVQGITQNRDMYVAQGKRAFGDLARESAIAAKNAALETVEDYYGIETNAETGQRKIRKLKLARAAVKTVIMPVGVGTKVARKAAVAGAKEAFQTGRSGLSEATRSTFAQPSAYESSAWTASSSDW